MTNGSRATTNKKLPLMVGCTAIKSQPDHANRFGVPVSFLQLAERAAKLCNVSEVSLIGVPESK
jgi:hypothetical protein